VRSSRGEPLGWQRGSVLGLYAHGMFESADVIQALFGVRPRSLNEVFDGLADFIDRHFAAGFLRGLV
jgi:adenosylcobyric acid synthase